MMDETIMEFGVIQAIDKKIRAQLDENTEDVYSCSVRVIEGIGFKYTHAEKLESPLKE